MATFELTTSYFEAHYSENANVAADKKTSKIPTSKFIGATYQTDDKINFVFNGVVIGIWSGDVSEMKLGAVTYEKVNTTPVGNQWQTSDELFALIDDYISASIISLL